MRQLKMLTKNREKKCGKQWKLHCKKKRLKIKKPKLQNFKQIAFWNKQKSLNKGLII